jgi:hypothetical protein
MKRTEALIYPAAAAVLVAMAGIASLQSASFAPAARASVTVSALDVDPVGEVPLIGEITVEASRIESADLNTIADAARY